MLVCRSLRLTWAHSNQRARLPPIRLSAARIRANSVPHSLQSSLTATPQPSNAAQAPPPMTWTGDIARRLRLQWFWKAVGLTGFMWIFFTLYFHLLRHPAQAVLVMPLTALDRAIPFQPAAFVGYASLWLYVGLPAALMLSLRELFFYGLWIGTLCLTGLACFYFWPSAVPAYDFAAAAAHSGATHPGIQLLQGVDAAGNACPSLHVATATFSAMWMHKLLRATGAKPLWLLLNAAWLVLIVYSTLAIKQHVVWDVLAGLLLAVGFALPALRLNPPAVRVDRAINGAGADT
jgi:membrane-associated phospholipid phosphatase